MAQRKPETARILSTDMSALLLGRAIFRQKNSLRHAAMMCQRSLRARTYPMILHCCTAPHVA